MRRSGTCVLCSARLTRPRLAAGTAWLCGGHGPRPDEVGQSPTLRARPRTCQASITLSKAEGGEQEWILGLPSHICTAGGGVMHTGGTCASACRPPCRLPGAARSAQLAWRMCRLTAGCQCRLHAREWRHSGGRSGCAQCLGVGRWHRVPAAGSESQGACTQPCQHVLLCEPSIQIHAQTVTTAQTAAHPNLQATSRGVWPILLRMLTNIAMARAAAFGFLFLLR